MLERDEVERWRDAVRAELALMLPGFEARYGYPPGTHEISAAADVPPVGQPGDLAVFYQVVGEVSLPDVDVGYWIHPTGDHHPHALSDGRRIVVFGSDGGGALFAVPDPAGAPVLRLAGDAGGATEVAPDLRSFLASVLGELTGRP